jgi:hypothetical protein
MAYRPRFCAFRWIIESISPPLDASGPILGAFQRKPYGPSPRYTFTAYGSGVLCSVRIDTPPAPHYILSWR